MKFCSGPAVLSISVVLIAFSGCNNSSSDSTTGSAALAVTDSANTNLTTFQATVNSVYLQTSDGSTATLLSTPVRVDFASLGDLSLVLKMVDLAAATYTGGNVTLDWTGAVAQIAGKGTAATILGSDGNPLTGTTTLLLTFPAGSATVAGGQMRLFEFDFDLDSSVEVDATANTVTVSPTVVLRVDRVDQKTLLLGGTLQSVDGSGGFILAVARPGGASIGNIACVALDTSYFQVNGVSSAALTGYTSLSGLIGGRVEVYGHLDTSSGLIAADFVEAGTGTIGGGTSFVTGVVTARDGINVVEPNLTVLGYSADSSGNPTQVNQSFAVQVSHANTKVVLFDSSTATYTTDDINVGQRVQVFGTLSGTTMDAKSNGGVLRLWPTRVYGIANGPVVSGSTEALEINIDQVDCQGVAAFNWTVGGTVQATLAAFDMDIGSLEASDIVSGTPVCFLGYFTHVITGARTIENFDAIARVAAPVWLRLRYSPASSTALATISTTEIDLNLTGAALAEVDAGFTTPVALPASPTPKLLPPTTTYSGALYTVSAAGSLATYADFASFAADLSARKAAGAKLYALRAAGQYDATNNLIYATEATVILQ